MKSKISISVDEETLDLIDESVKNGSFRNRSHAFEYSLKKIARAENDS
ncbi:MAG TPA: ribbon-helix-helix domain-containing protein [Candidatus Nanoarchaeia archaeon]|nr:ribbon-helix-helix domain-containing protein [Candidatus Nanoarchaeia archaeon]